MADAFQVAAAAFAVAELALKIFEELSTFITRAKNADATAKELRSKIERFCKSVNTVRLTAAHRKAVCSKGFECWEENDIWAIVLDSLKGWNGVLDEFKVGVERLRPGPSQHSSFPWIEKALKQLELDRKGPWIERFESAIGSHIEEISLSLNCLQIIILGDNYSRANRLDRRLERFNGASVEYSSTPPSRALHSHHAPRKEGAIVRCVEIAREIHKRSSIYSDSAPSIPSRRDSLSDKVDDLGIKVQTSGAEGATDVEFDDLVTLSEFRPQSQSQIRTLSPASSRDEDPADNEVDDLLPGFDDTTPREVLDALIQNYKDQAQTEYDEAHFDKAEHCQRRLIDCVMESNHAYGHDYNIQAEKRSLANILRKKDDDRSRREARGLLDLLFSATPQTTPSLPQAFPTNPRPEAERREHSKLYLEKAELEYQEFRQKFTNARVLDLSEKYAKRAFKLLLTLELVDDAKADFVRSVKHLVRVYEIKRDNVAVQTYRHLYLDSAASNPQLTPSISTTTAQTSASRLPHLDRVPTFPTDLDVQNGVDAHGHTHLVSAILEKDPTKVERMLQHGADPNQLSMNKPPLLYAIDSGVDTIVMKLEMRGATVNAESGAKAPLIYAIEKRATNMVKLLCDLGADVEASPRKTTPLLLAARLKHPEIVRTLCEHNARTNTRCSEGRSALHCAISQYTGHPRDTVCEVLEILLENRADPYARDAEGKSPLYHAIQEKDDKCLEFLLETPGLVDLEAPDDEGRTPLSLAMRKNYLRGVQLCLAKGAVVPDPLPREANKYIQGLAKKRRGSNESSAGASVDAVSSRPSTTGSNRRSITATRDSAGTSRSWKFSFFVKRSS